MFRIPKTFSRSLAAWVVAAPLAASAHHGWDWTQEQESRLSGTLESISLGNPHAHVTLRNDQGLWEVDLAPPSATERAGFVAASASIGDKASVTGHRSKDAKQLAFKAETITVNGRTFDVYPNRPKALKPAP